MKRVGNLYGHIACTDNIKVAFLKAARGKYDRQEVKLFRSNFTININKIKDQLLSLNPDLGHYRFFHVYDPKPRTICAAFFPERVLHHAVMNICEPYLDNYAIYDSYACRKQKGTRKALARASNFMDRNTWFLKLDIAKYFDSIDHLILLDHLTRRYKDCKLLGLFERILCTYSTLPGKGVPIGNLISQHFANHYLSAFDHWIKEDHRVKYYIRYMDDFLIFSSDRHYLKSMLQNINIFLNDRLKLKLKSDIQLNRCSHGVRFLGYRLVPGAILLSLRGKRRFIRKFRVYEDKYLKGIWDEESLARHIEPLVDFTRVARADSFRTRVISQHGHCHEA